MPDKKPVEGSNDGGRFTSKGCDLLEIREEDTQPGTGLSEKDKQRLREKYGGKMPPYLEPELIQIDEEDTQPGTVSESYRKHLREKYGPKDPPANGPSKDA